MAPRGPLKIAVLVKEVPDAAVRKRIDPASGRIDRSGERTLNPYDTHAIECAVQLKEGPDIEVGEIVAVTMGPASAVRALHKAVSLGADRSIHLSDDALTGSDVAATGYALARVLQTEAPDLVLLGQQSDDGESYTVGSVIAEHLGAPSLSQVIKLEIAGGGLRVERQAEYGYDVLSVRLPAVISVGDAINEPRYPSLRAIMGAKKKPLATMGIADAGIDPALVGSDGSKVRCSDFHAPATRSAGEMLEDEDTPATVATIISWLEARKLVS